jgi:hypothetical protein
LGITFTTRGRALITFQLETVSEFYNDSKPLLDDYWIEVDERRDITNINLDIQTYLHLEENGLLRIVTAREYGDLIGFVVYTVVPCHQTSQTKAITEITYIIPSYRGTNLVDDLLNNAERLLTEVDVLFMTIKTEFPHDTLAARNNYIPVETVFMKEL